MTQPDCIQTHIEHEERAERSQQIRELRYGQQDEYEFFPPPDQNIAPFEIIDEPDPACPHCGEIGGTPTSVYDPGDPSVGYSGGYEAMCSYCEPGEKTAMQIAELHRRGLVKAAIETALSHLRMVRMQAPRQLAQHVEIAERLVKQIGKVA